MPGLLPTVDPDGLLEYSVVFTDRSLNHMSARFTRAMQSLLSTLRKTYAAQAVALIPGGGSCAMEAVARQLAGGKDVVVVRNGLFSFRWSAILGAGRIAAEVTVCQAQPVDDSPHSAWVPAPIDEVEETIARVKPGVVFAPHVETAAGMLLPDDYVRRLAAAVSGTVLSASGCGSKPAARIAAKAGVSAAGSTSITSVRAER